MNENLIVKSEVRGNKKVEVYYDEFADCPVQCWDMGAVHLFTYTGSNWLSDDCDWKEAFGEYGNNRHTLLEALVGIALDNVDYKDVVLYMKKNWSDPEGRFRYDASSHCWVMEYYKKICGGWIMYGLYPASELNEGCYTRELLEELDRDELLELIQNYAKDIVIKEWSCTGYSQGDWCDGISYCKKDALCDIDHAGSWKERAESLIESEIKDIERWIYGDVLSYVLYERAVENGEWKEIESCCDYYMSPDELIDYVFGIYEEENTAEKSA